MDIKLKMLNLSDSINRNEEELLKSTHELFRLRKKLKEDYVVEYNGQIFKTFYFDVENASNLIFEMIEEDVPFSSVKFILKSDIYQEDNVVSLCDYRDLKRVA